MEAFALLEEFTGTVKSQDDDGKEVEVSRFRGGSFALADGATFDLAEHLGEDGSGKIVTSDPELIAHLDYSNQFKRVPVGDSPPAPVNPLAEMTVTALRGLPEANAVNGAGGMRKAELAARVELARQGEDPNQALVEAPDGTFVADVNADGGDGHDGTNENGGQS